MPATKRVKTLAPSFRSVGVISTPADLRLAMRMSSPPDLFEIRLDYLFPAKGLEDKISELPAPRIITARHPAEGGKHNLAGPVRRDLLLRFLSGARYIDVELRSARAFQTLIDRARHRGVETIISFHDFGSTPTLGSLRAKASAAKALGATVFKVAARTDTPAQLGRLLELVSERRTNLAVCAMGMGRLGIISRILMTYSGSALVYTSLREPLVKGQISLEHFRRVLRETRRA